MALELWKKAINVHSAITATSIILVRKVLEKTQNILKISITSTAKNLLINGEVTYQKTILSNQHNAKNFILGRPL